MQQSDVPVLPQPSDLQRRIYGRCHDCKGSRAAAGSTCRGIRRRRCRGGHPAGLGAEYDSRIYIARLPTFLDGTHSQ